jgi:hypothetical protein
MLCFPNERMARGFDLAEQVHAFAIGKQYLPDEA